jgi:hypothetical protein
MKSLNLLVIIIVVFAISGFRGCKTKVSPAPPVPCCIDFNNSPFAPGTSYRVLNDSIYASCGFTVKTDKLYINPNSYFNFVRGENAKPVFGAGNIVNTNNATLHFINTGSISQLVITFDYLDMGGTENFSVNGSLYIGELSAAPATLGGATVSVTSTPIPLPAGGHTGTVKISGTISEFKIGGQEFYLDNFCFR